LLHTLQRLTASRAVLDCSASGGDGFLPVLKTALS